MKRNLAFGLCIVLSACSTTPGPLNEGGGPVPSGPGLSHLCLAPDGQVVDVPAHAPGLTCGAPNRYVALSLCRQGQRPAGETAEARRRAAADDDSLVGDTYRGAPVCRVPAPH